MNRTAIAALIAAVSTGPALAQTTLGTAQDPNLAVDPGAEATDTDVVVVDEVEVVEDAEIIEVEPTTDTAAVDTAAATTGAMDMSGMVRADDITDGPIYSTGEAYDDAAWTASDPYAATRMGAGTTTGTAAGTTAATGAYQPYAYDAGYETIGDIEDVILDASGQMVGVVAEVGGFLGLGSKDVFLPVDDVRLVSPGDAQYAYVTRLTEDQLTDLPAIEEGLFD